MDYLIESLKNDPFNKGDLVEAIEYGIPHTEIARAIKTGLETQMKHWESESKKIPNRETSYMTEHLTILNNLVCVLENYHIGIYLDNLPQ